MSSLRPYKRSGDGFVDADDPKYLFNAAIFNAITRHPGHNLLFSSRQRITTKVERYALRQLRKAERQRKRRLRSGL